MKSAIEGFDLLARYPDPGPFHHDRLGEIHGVGDPGLPGQRRPVRTERERFGDDGILTAAEASYLDLDGVDLVVLSACQTALGKAESGEGVIGLVRGFQMAGAKRVIASLWQVDDEATRLLMQHLYDGMLREEDPLSPAEALREAALKVRGSTGSRGQSFAAPRYWAAFVAYGR